MSIPIGAKRNAATSTAPTVRASSTRQVRRDIRSRLAASSVAE
ncbi:hypothetical protein AB0J85_16545 [Micromonospora echinofusca]